MSEIELKARELLAAECPECGGENGHDTEDGWLRCGRCSDPHTVTRHQATQAIIAALSQIPSDIGIPTSAPQWQPIESAPKDGTQVLVDHPAWHSRVLPGEWDERLSAWRVDGFGFPSTQPTKWQPLPAPPEVEG